MNDNAVLAETAVGAGETFHLLLMPGFSMIDFTGIVEVLRQANNLSGYTCYRWETASLSGDTVPASNGLPVKVNVQVQDLSPDGAVVILAEDLSSCRSTGPLPTAALQAWLRRLASRGTRIGAASTGTRILADAGVLHGYKCTSHWSCMDILAEEYEDLEIFPRRYVIDRTRFTSAGGTATVDMMLKLVAESHGDELATDIASQLMVENSFATENRERRPLHSPFKRIHPRVQRATDLMKQNLEEPMSLSEVSQQAGTSRRHLERLFNRQLSISPSQFYLGLRLEKGYRLLTQSSLPVTKVAMACGFNTSSHFSKRFRDKFSVSPQTLRRKLIWQPQGVRLQSQG